MFGMRDKLYFVIIAKFKLCLVFVLQEWVMTLRALSHPKGAPVLDFLVIFALTVNTLGYWSSYCKCR